MHRSPLRLAALAAVGITTSALGLAALAGPAQAATATAAPSAKAAACDRAAWESPVQGAPKGLASGSASGDYLWHDSHGFHLRVTHPGHERRVYTGVITASAPMRYTPAKLEKGDVVKLSANHRTLTFAFVDYGHIDGVNFHTDCASALRVSRLHIGNSSLTASHVFLGEHRSHPAAIPFTVHRKAA